MPRMRWLLGMLATALVACHRGPTYAPGLTPAEAEAEDPEGIFRYDLEVLEQRIRGRVIIADTLVLLAAEGDACAPDPLLFGHVRLRNRSDREYVTFRCESGMLLRIHRRSPATRSLWERVAPNARTGAESYCLRGRWTRTGRMECYEWYDGRPRTNASVDLASNQVGALPLMRVTALTPDTSYAAHAWSNRAER